MVAVIAGGKDWGWGVGVGVVIVGLGGVGVVGTEGVGSTVTLVAVTALVSALTFAEKLTAGPVCCG